MLSQALIKEFPEHQHLFSQPQFQIGKRRIPTHNGLLRTFTGADGMKTGFTCDSGYNVVGSASREGRRLVAVVLGEPSGLSRSMRAASLMEHGFQTYQWKAQLGAPTLTTLAPEANAGKGPVSARNTVMTWDCGGRRRPVARAKRVRSPGAAVAQAKAGQPNGQANAQPPAAGDTAKPAASGAKAKPNSAVHAARSSAAQSKTDAQ